MASYSRFALYYDILTKNISYKDRATYFNKLIEKYSINDSKDSSVLLDLACGTGSLAEQFCRQGYKVIGVDKSQEMLTMALEKKIDKGLDIQYLHQDMTKLNLYNNIDVTVCALDSLNHINDLDAVKKTFAGVYKFTKPDGIFIFDVNTKYKHKNVIGNNTFVYDAEQVYCVWQNTYVEEKSKINIHLDFFERQGDFYLKSEEDFSETAFDTSELESALKEVGFEVITEYDYDTMNPVKDNSEKIIFVAKKAVN